MVGSSFSLPYSLPSQMITEGKLYTGSSDGTLRVWNAKDVSEELLWGFSFNDDLFIIILLQRSSSDTILTVQYSIGWWQNYSYQGWWRSASPCTGRCRRRHWRDHRRDTCCWSSHRRGRGAASWSCWRGSTSWRGGGRHWSRRGSCRGRAGQGYGRRDGRHGTRARRPRLSRPLWGQNQCFWSFTDSSLVDCIVHWRWWFLYNFLR